MEIVGVVGQLTVAEVYRSVTSIENEVDSLPPLPVNRDDARRQFDKHGLLPCESLLREHLAEYPGHSLSQDESRDLINRLRPYKVSKRELIQLLAHRPYSRPILNICLDDMDRFSEEQQDEIIEIVRDPARVEAVDEDEEAEDAADGAEPVAED